VSLQTHARGCRGSTGGVVPPGGGLEVFCQFDDGATRLRRLGGQGWRTSNTNSNGGRLWQTNKGADDANGEGRGQRKRIIQFERVGHISEISRRGARRRSWERDFGTVG
jgi:hypothetical protein